MYDLPQKDFSSSKMKKIDKSLFVALLCFFERFYYILRSLFLLIKYIITNCPFPVVSFSASVAMVLNQLLLLTADVFFPDHILF